MGFLAGVEVGALKYSKSSYTIDIYKLIVKFKAFFMFIQKSHYFRYLVQFNRLANFFNRSTVKPV